MLLAAVESTAEGLDPSVWIQAGGVLSGFGLIAFLIIRLLMLWSKSGENASAELTRVNKVVAAQDKQIGDMRQAFDLERADAREALRKAHQEIDAERKLRFEAEDREHDANMESERLQRIIKELRKEADGNDKR